MTSILDFVPAGFTPRSVQIDVLQSVERSWNTHKVFVIQAPVSSGKSLIAITIANWAQSLSKSTAILTPQVMLQDQYVETFPDIPSLKGRARYSCHDEDAETCEDRHAIDDKYCAECPYVACKSQAAASPSAIYNLYSYMATRDNKQVLIVDEAHNIFSQLQEFYTLKIYQDEENYPNNLNTQGDAVAWLESHVPKLQGMVAKMYQSSKIKLTPELTKHISTLRRKITKFQGLIEGIQRSPGHFFYEEKIEKVRGRERRFLLIRPVTLTHTVNRLWDSHHKIVLMSGSINRIDLTDAGLNPQYSKFINCASPIPPENRPVLFQPVASMSSKHLPKALPLVAQRLNELLLQYPGKGIVHVTYDMVPKLKKLLDDPRFLFHTKTNKQTIYKKFRSSSEPLVLVAAGMSEGIDLVGEDYEWQVIAKVIFPSLGDKLIQHLKELDPEWYSWQTIKTVVQQSGRICRTPTDKGTTIILDANFRFLYYRSKNLFPSYFTDALNMKA